MVGAQLLSSTCVQQFAVATADQQIYKVMFDNIWPTPGVQQCVPTIGRNTHNHELQWQCWQARDGQFSGLIEIPKHDFGCVDKMLSDKKFP